MEQNDEAKKLHEEFDMLPLLIDILKDILTAGTNEESTRVGDVSATATSLKKKYEDAARLLTSLPGIDVSLDGQQEEILRAKEQLRQKKYISTHIPLASSW
ncbi:hypothetical protein, variant [Aphanomyces invadans]|uniref:Mediator of RNA polymerase II transcription subunit 9 n=2 Tax=Aphanomyces invadans TaxID=157072 RepID=A0A024UIG5_9STRA|nr:hypothetical protein, variant [Aphanomyces invadans]ETW05667.1 hypothetical protein, variant [Aphanomyces invadans]|eukprot:XP_008865444.1 hypothetical protein, variant [Aphanomyces invadans]